jgi:hypothetical protein
MGNALWSETKRVELRPGVDVVLKHIGTPQDPMLWSRLQSRWMHTRAKMEVRARKAVVEEFGSVEDAISALLPGEESYAAVNAKRVEAGLPAARRDFEAAVRTWVTSSEDWIDAFSARVKDLIQSGVVDGEREYERLYGLGGAELLQKAADAVTSFHDLEPSTGEG